MLFALYQKYVVPACAHLSILNGLFKKKKKSVLKAGSKLLSFLHALINFHI